MRRLRLLFLLSTFLVVFVGNYSVNLHAQNKLILVTDLNNNWTITKEQQPFTYNPANITEDWLTNTTTGPIDNTWTTSVKLADLANSQIAPVNNVGNGAKPLWIVENVCNYSDDYTKVVVYHMRNTFTLEGGCINISKAIMRFTVDNLCRVYINGHLIAGTNGLYDYPGIKLNCNEVCGFPSSAPVNNAPALSMSGNNFNQIEVSDITDHLVPGVNVMAVEVINVGGCGKNYGWFCGNIEIDYKAGMTISASQVEPENCQKKGSFFVSVSGGTAPYSYKINNGAYQSNSHFDNLDAGTYTVTVRDTNNCESSLEVTVDNEVVIPEVDVVNLDNYIDCSSAYTFIELSSPNPDLLYSLDSSPFATQNYFDNLSPGQHVIIAQDVMGCHSKPIVFEVYDEHEFALNISEDRICRGESIDFRGMKLTESGVYKDIVLTGGPCDSLYQMTLTVFEPSFVNFTRRLCLGDTIQIGGITYQETGNFIQNLTNINGCDSIVNINIIEQNPELCERSSCNYFIPNVFSPNNDGINDHFRVEKRNTVITYMGIYDRWGDVVFESYQIDPEWNGIFKGKQAEPGVYAYIIRGHCVEGDEFMEYGDVTLVR